MRRVRSFRLRQPSPNRPRRGQHHLQLKLLTSTGGAGGAAALRLDAAFDSESRLAAQPRRYPAPGMPTRRHVQGGDKSPHSTGSPGLFTSNQTHQLNLAAQPPSMSRRPHPLASLPAPLVGALLALAIGAAWSIFPRSSTTRRSGTWRRCAPSPHRRPPVRQSAAVRRSIFPSPSMPPSAALRRPPSERATS